MCFDGNFIKICVVVKGSDKVRVVNYKFLIIVIIMDVFICFNWECYYLIVINSNGCYVVCNYNNSYDL